jgi:hypothetical protein
MKSRVDAMKTRISKKRKEYNGYNQAGKLSQGNKTK